MWDIMTKKKHIIGLGCSWTQGEGGYPDEIVKQYNGRVQISLRRKNDIDIRGYELENSWVNVLCRDHFKEYTPINLGVKGIGNRAAVHQLHFVDNVNWDQTEGIIVFMMTGFERFDFFKQNVFHRNNNFDGYSNGDFVHYKWRTMWPYINTGADAEAPIWEIYATLLWSEQFVACEQMMALLDLQLFAKCYNYKIVIANGFNNHYYGIKKYLVENTGPLADKFNWEGYIHDSVPYTAFVQKLVWCDGILDPNDWGNFFNFYRAKDWPSKFLTNCEGAHPTIEGYKMIASEIAKFIKSNEYA